jgi:predicted phosphodiesterase
MSTTIQILSDIHLEYLQYGGGYQVQPTGADILILAGDIAPASMWPYQQQFFNTVANNYQQVIYVAGNHEYYLCDMGPMNASLAQYLANTPNISVLYNMPKVIGDITFVGCTLWTNLGNNNPATYQAGFNATRDYQNICNNQTAGFFVTPGDTYNQFQTEYAFIQGCVEQATTNNVVVITHHAPSFDSIANGYTDARYGYVNGLYATELSSYIEANPKIKYWIHGHTHQYKNYMIGNTNIICNPVGYTYETTGYVANLVITIP